MTPMWRSLLDTLEETLAFYRNILELSEAKRTLLIQARPGEIDELSRRMETLAMEGAALEKRRAAATAVIVSALGLEKAKPTISELAAIAEPDAAELLDSIGRELGTTVENLSQINAINAKLTEQALAFVSYNLNLLTRCQAEDTYAPTGSVAAQRAVTALLDRKV